MRRHQDIADLLRGTHGDVYGAHGHTVHQRPLAAHGEHLGDLLDSLLVDPNLHTDLRMRLHEEIPALLRAADAEALQRAVEK